MLKSTRRIFTIHVNHRKIMFTRNLCDDKKDITKIEIPPEPTTCCMSGCANCVWIEYATKLSEIFKENDEQVQKMILDKITDPNMKSFLAMELRNMKMNKKKK